MKLSKKAIEEFKALYKEKTGKDLSDEEAQEQGFRLLNFTKLLVDQAMIQMRREKRLKDEPEGFHLPEGKHYNCIICYQSIEGQTSWWDQWGPKCIDCQSNLKNKVFPPEICKNRDLWFSDWQLKSKFEIHPSTAGKLRRDGVLKPLELKDKNGNIYFRIYLIKEHKKWLREK